jgi:cytochrome d ubiquinol oxidase subunit II
MEAWFDHLYLSRLQFALTTMFQRRRERAPYLWTLLLFLFAFVVLGAGLYPHILPPAVTLAQAAAPSGTLTVMLLVIGPLLPLMLLYNAYQYRVFAGKAEESYED